MVTMAEPTTRRVEFVGLPNPFFDPAVQAMKARGEMTAKRRAQLTKMEQRRQMQGFARVPGHTRRWVGPEHGFSRRYEWNTANNFTVEMAIEDIDLLLDKIHDQIPDPDKRRDMKLAHQQAFRVVDDVLVL